jgi:hypothetical protein
MVPSLDQLCGFGCCNYRDGLIEQPEGFLVGVVEVVKPEENGIDAPIVLHLLGSLGLCGVTWKMCDEVFQTTRHGCFDQAYDSFDVMRPR